MLTGVIPCEYMFYKVCPIGAPFLYLFDHNLAIIQKSLYLCKNMNDDIHESVSQRSSGEETAENSRIHDMPKIMVCGSQ